MSCELGDGKRRYMSSSASPCTLYCSSLGKKDLNRLFNIMMSYDSSGNEWKRFEFWDATVRT
jgi:hypothetical protein